jgi:phage/plasmid-associated DNA primase
MSAGENNIVELQRAGRATASSSEIDITDTDIANGQRLATRHGQDLRFTPERGWFVWDGRRWAVDDKGIAVQARAKESALSIFDEIKNAIDRDGRMRHARRSQSKSAIEAA